MTSLHWRYWHCGIRLVVAIVCTGSMLLPTGSSVMPRLEGAGGVSIRDPLVRQSAEAASLKPADYETLATPTPQQPVVGQPTPTSGTAYSIQGTSGTATPTVVQTAIPVLTATATLTVGRQVTSTATPTGTVVPDIVAQVIPVTSKRIDPRAGGIIEARIWSQTAQGTADALQSVVLIVPPGAVTQTVIIRLAVALLKRPATPILRLNDVGVGAAIDLSAQTLRGTYIHVFNRSLTWQSSYNPADLGPLNPRSLTNAYYDNPSKTWITLPSTVDQAGRLVTTNVGHFTLFQVRATARTSALFQAALARRTTTVLKSSPVAPARVVSKGPQTNASPLPGNVPVLLILPSGQVGSDTPAAIHVLGAPHATLTVTYRMPTMQIVHVISLDVHGYAAISAPHVNTRQRVHIAVDLALDGVTSHAEGDVTITP